ncbi:MAG TPA: hypothetical protein VHD32_17315 [Candidatus Didemnitutus sp.]|nr:hypothetical protein [Candidatus Didemnitutus sp.]
MPPVPAAIAPPAAEKPYSRLGIASFVISVGSGIALLATFAIAGVMGRKGTPGNYPGQMVIGFVIILLFIAEFAAAGLGIAGICQSNTRRIFAVLGTVLSVLAILGAGGLMLLGIIIAMRNHG